MKLNIRRWILRGGYVLNFPNGRARLTNVGPHFALYLSMSIVTSSYNRCLAQRKLNIRRWNLRGKYVVNFPNGGVRTQNVGPHFALYLSMAIAFRSQHCPAHGNFNIKRMRYSRALRSKFPNSGTRAQNVGLDFALDLSMTIGSRSLCQCLARVA